MGTLRRNMAHRKLHPAARQMKTYWGMGILELAAGLLITLLSCASAERLDTYWDRVQHDAGQPALLGLSPSPSCFIHNHYDAWSKWLTLNVLPSFYSQWKSALLLAASSVLSSLDVACSQICSSMFSWVRNHVGLYVFVEQPVVHAVPVILWLCYIMTGGVKS